MMKNKHFFKFKSITIAYICSNKFVKLNRVKIKKINFKKSIKDL